MKTTCFMPYDIRGRIPDDLNADLARRIAYAYAQVLKPARVVVGRDIRLSSVEISQAVIEGLRLAGVDVYDIGMCGTENVYFTTAHEKMDGGIMVTASHNPIDYNGLKLVREDARPIGQDTGLQDIQALVEDDGTVLPEKMTGDLHTLDPWEDYIEHLLGYVDAEQLAWMKILVNPGNGGAGLVMQRLRDRLPCQFIDMDFEPDGAFPNGVPNPFLPENQSRTASRVRAEQAELGIAWDGDFDRCFLFDENGEFVKGYYLVGLIAAELLSQNPGEGVVYDPRLTWNTIEVVEAAGGKIIKSRTGHSFIKQLMREHNAIYGGEISGHHYFRQFSYCDSGMIPWLLVIALMSRTGKSISTLIREYQARYPASDEINTRVGDAADVMAKIEADYMAEGAVVDHTDGVSFEYPDWRFNLRMSNTEPLLRLNVESRVSMAHMQEKLDALIERIHAYA